MFKENVLFSLFPGVPSPSCIMQKSKADLQVLILNIEFSRESVNYSGLKTRIFTPTHIRESSTLTRFKNGL